MKYQFNSGTSTKNNLSEFLHHIMFWFYFAPHDMIQKYPKRPYLNILVEAF